MWRGRGINLSPDLWAVPRCYVERLEPKPLRPGVLYRIQTALGSYGEGFSRLALTVENPTWEAAHADVGSWPDAANPNSAYPGESPPPTPMPADTNLLSANAIPEVPAE